MKTMVLVPCMEAVQTEFCQSLVNLQKVGDVCFEFLSGSLVYKSRTDLGRKAIHAGVDFCLWLDSDVIFPPGLMVDLMEDIQGRDMVTGVYHMRRAPFKPVIWKKLRQGLTAFENENEVWLDYPKDQGIFEVEGCGFGCVMTSGKLLKACLDNYGLPFSPRLGFGEDITLCLEANELGFKLYCDSSVKVGHIGQLIVTEEVYQHAKI